MKTSFMKMVLAVIVGTIIVSIISTMFTTCVFMGMVAAASTEETTTSTKPGDVMLLKINTEVTEVPSSMPFFIDDAGNFSMEPGLSLRGYLNAIECAKKDPNITGIYLNTDGMAAAPATYEALRNALADFKQAGKWIISYNDSYSIGQYYVASVADSVYVNTIGGMSFDGMSSLLTYPKNLLDKLGIEMQIFRVGTFKSAVEPYMVDHISEANYLQTQTYLKNIWNVMVGEIAASRNMTVEALDSLADQAVSYMNPEEIIATGLVDGMVYKTDVEQVILSKIGQSKLDGHLISAKSMATNAAKLQPMVSDKVAVLYANGEIATEAEGADDAIYYNTLIKDIRAIAADNSIKAVVFRVNSPGGSAFASEQIWKALEDLKAVKPLVVSMGDYAASGGYYISCNANYIVAEPTTLTGSIGVFGIIPNLSGLVSDKLGVNFEEVKTHKFGTLHTMRAATEDEKVKIQRGVEFTYDLFTKRCADGRGMEQDSIKAIAGGRVWTGSDAVNLGLVDELGGLNVAVAKAAELAGLTAGSYARTVYPFEKSKMEVMMELFGEKAEDLSIRIADIALGTTPADREALKFIKSIKDADRIQARSFEAVRF